jgi:dihydrofolate synthase/folylpolyglutamate synthase
MAEMNRMDFRTAVDYVLSFADYERLSRSAVVFDIARMEALLKRIGNPHLAAKSVHVAGTKGKGSTSAMIASVLTASGYRTGLYTSPHLQTIRERVQIDGRPISEGEFADGVKGLKPEIEHLNRFGALGELTTFEILTALAFAYFKEKAVDFQVLETGLGGRLDATNVVKPEVCVITSISLDHTEVLGDTIAKIAAEKAGIIKPGCQVVCAPQKAEALAVIEKVCRERGANLIKIGEEVTWRKTKNSDLGQSFHLKGTKSEYDLTIPLLGEHQLENAAAAVAALEVMRGQAPGISDRSIAIGLAQVNWPGRLQVLQRNPLFVVDGAHNADSARRLREAIKQYFEFDDVILIVGISQEKDIPGIVAELSSLTSQVIVTHSAHPRAAIAATLVAEFSKLDVNPEVTEDIASAVGLALAKAEQGDLICVTGSLFVVSEVMEYFKAAAAQNDMGNIN